MNTNAINNCETGKEAPTYTRAIIQFIYMLYLCAYYIMIYSCILMVNAKKTEEIERIEDDSDVIGFLKPEEVVDVASSNEVEEEILGLINPKEVVELAGSNEVEEDMETLQIYDFEGTGEQLRRLRAYNPKNDVETEEQYEKRIWTMADKEDAEEEEIKKVLSVVVNEVAVEEEIVLVANANEVVAEALVNLENDVNVWHTIEDGKCRYKGEWKNGLPNGKGIKHFYKTDSYIDGNFVDGFAEGHCKQTFEQTWEKTVPYYEGEFKRNNYNGKGEYHYGDGDYYKGMWKDGKYNGQGAAYSKRLDRTWVGEYCNDVKVEGNWVNGEI